jgi:hypothetical protein
VRRATKKNDAPQCSYRPRQRRCPRCQSTLKRSHILWRKHLITLDGPVRATNWGYRCPNSGCPESEIVYRSAEVEGLHLKNRQFGRDLIVHVGYRRFWHHQTLDEIHDWLTQDLGVIVSRRQVLNLLADFLALLSAAQPMKVRNQLKTLKRLVVGLDGMQPEKGNACLYIARELQADLTLLAENLDDSSDETIRTRLIQPLKALADEMSLPWHGVVSDAQETIRTAVSKELDGVPHQACQSHCLREAGELTFLADRNMKKQLKAIVRQRIRRVERRIERLPEADPYRPVLADYANVMRSILLEGGVAPFDLGGVRIFDDLTALAASLACCQRKREHVLLRRLIKIADCRLSFADQVARLRRQRQWLIDLEHLLDSSKQSTQLPLTSQEVAQAVDRYLTELLAKVAADTDEENQRVATHINETFRSRWWGLFICYDVEGLPRTNNDLERYMRRIKTGQRRVSGRKNVHDFLIRYGRYAAYVDYRESVDELLARLSQVSHGDFLRERQALDIALLRERKRHRFRHHRADYLRELEERWASAVGKVHGET